MSYLYALLNFPSQRGAANESGDESEKENAPSSAPLKRHRTTTANVIKDMLKQRIREDELRLTDAQLSEEWRHQEVLAGQQQMLRRTYE